MRMNLLAAVAAGAAGALPIAANASSHMDAPLITFDDAANTTDVYAFLSEDAKGRLYLTTAFATLFTFRLAIMSLRGVRTFLMSSISRRFTPIKTLSFRPSPALFLRMATIKTFAKAIA
jgi:hypothetical protein